MTDSAIKAAFAQLTALLGARATTTHVQREHHSAGESWHPAALPDIVCFPHSNEEVSAIIKVAAQHGVPLVAFGAGTSLEGQVNAIRGGISLDMRRMSRVLNLSVPDMDVTVEAGITRLALNEKLNNTGLTFFIDPGADATIGGMTATRASGTTAVRYGTMRENVLGLTVVLADGSVIRTGGHARKSAAGYDLTHLFVGSEGTLGVITEVVLRLHALPEAVSAATCTFASVKDAVESAIEAIQLSLGMARIEFLDARQIEAINQYSKTNLSVAPTLLFEFHALNERDLADRAELLRGIVEEHNGSGFAWQNKLEDREALWKARHDVHHATHTLVPNSRVLTTDVCVPISRLAECIVATEADMQRLSFPTTIAGHVGDGNFHVLCVLREANADDMDEAARFSDKLVQRALQMGGTCTGEHGIGYGKMKYLEQEHGDAVRVMRAIKLALDPQNIMNPGKVIAIE